MGSSSWQYKVSRNSREAGRILGAAPRLRYRERAGLVEFPLIEMVSRNREETESQSGCRFPVGGDYDPDNVAMIASRTALGSAPLTCFITLPMIAPTACCLPALKSSTAFGLSAMAASMAAVRAPVS